MRRGSLLCVAVLSHAAAASPIIIKAAHVLDGVSDKPHVFLPDPARISLCAR